VRDDLDDEATAVRNAVREYMMSRSGKLKPKDIAEKPIQTSVDDEAIWNRY
jgi:hypothetical protein